MKSVVKYLKLDADFYMNSLQFTLIIFYITPLS